MGLMDLDFNLGSGSSDSWFSDDSWDSDYDSAFNLAGTTDNDQSWWKTVGQAINTPVGSSIVAGVAGGALNYLSSKRQTDALKKTSKDRQRQLDAHNASIAKPFTGAKKVRFHGDE